MSAPADQGGAERDGGVESLTIEPPARRWPPLVDAHRTARLSGMTSRFRSELGLPTDRPIVMAGHQAQVWHPGILAKQIAAWAAARALGAAAAWIIVDQDDNDPFEISFPVRRPGERIVRESWPARPGTATRDDVPAAMRPAERSLDHPAPAPPGVLALPSVGDGLRRIHSAMLAHAEEPSSARQVAAAAADLAAPWTGGPVMVFSSDLHRTALFTMLVGIMKRDPGPCADSYNRAVAMHSGAGVQMLADSDGRRGPELPLWRMRRADGRAWRERVYAETLASAPPQELAPRALFMTALLRLGGCDLFIHGTGAGGDMGYDRIMEHWVRDWLRAESIGVVLAPTATVSATLRLPLGIEPVSPERAARAIWIAHHARHDPSLLGDADAAAAKKSLVSQIAAARKAGQHPRAEFAGLHALLDDVRSRHSAKLGELAAQASHLRNRRDDADVIADRTWPFPLYPREQLDALRDRIDAQFQPGR